MAKIKFTILHSNDMHGDFLAEIQSEGGELVGGLALLSGYINKVRQEEENVLFVIAGDMLRGSLLDTEYKGISTMEIMNYLAPDVVTVGNHEFDYGLPHLLFLDRIANFPIVNANLYIKNYNKRLMLPYIILQKAGLNILLTGVITEKVIHSIYSRDPLIGSFITLKDAAEEIGRITNAYKTEDIDLTIILSHIGFESDKKLAKLLKPEWGVDMIIGGHSHTILTEPEKVNDILIAQAGVGTDQIGRFDIIVDEETNSIVKYEWQLVPINSKIAKPDERLREYIQSFKRAVEEKYPFLLCKFAKKLTHPTNLQETALGNLFADIFAERANSDVMLLGSGSIRLKALGPIVTLMDFISCFPFNETLIKYSITGKRLKNIFQHVMRPENRTGEGECYQVNNGVQAIYNDRKKKLESLKVRGVPVSDRKLYTLCLQNFHIVGCSSYLDISEAELREAKGARIISTASQEVLEEYLRNHQNLSRDVEGRLVYI
ncbi:MAG: bifunctional metallophosphatase/5'-nucleotidase [Promethearchaeota archaeon]